MNKLRQKAILQILNDVSSGWVAEFKFHPGRKWRADFACPKHKFIVEIEGGAWVGGRHTRGGGYTGDMEKYNAATLLGYKILRYTPQQETEMMRDVVTLERNRWE